MIRPWLLTASLLGCAACVSIPPGVRATFAEAEEHENDYLRPRSDAPSPRGFLAQPQDASTDASPSTSTSTSTATATSTPTSTSTDDAGVP